MKLKDIREGSSKQRPEGSGGRPPRGGGRKAGTEDMDQLVEKAVDEAVERAHQPWITTFGDLMSLLLVFFVMLYAMSEIKVQKFVEMAESLREGFGAGVPPAYSGLVDDTSTTEEGEGFSEEDPVEDYLGYIEQTLKSFIAEHDLANTIEVVRDESGVVLKIQDVVLFDVASAELKSESRWIAAKLGEIVKQIAAPVVVSGHTDSTPIHSTRFPSNWELSGARASTLARIFIARGFEPEGLHIEGYAATKPIASNATPEGRAENRRVELLYSRQNVFMKLVEDQQENRAQWWPEVPTGAERLDELRNSLGDTAEP